MIFHAGRGRALASIESGLTRSDPGLAAQFDRFNTRYPRSPVKRERLSNPRARSKKPLAILLLPLALLLLSWYSIQGGGHGRTAGCKTVALAMCPASPSPGRAARAPAHQGMGPRASHARVPASTP